MTFETNLTDDYNNSRVSPIPSGNPGDYIFEDLENDSEPLPGSAIGQKHPSNPGDSDASAYIGNAVASKPVKKKVTMTNPFTEKQVQASVKSRNVRKGETVFRKLL
jgi:hypothetical protein